MASGFGQSLGKIRMHTSKLHLLFHQKLSGRQIASARLAFLQIAAWLLHDFHRLRAFSAWHGLSGNTACREEFRVQAAKEKGKQDMSSKSIFCIAISHLQAAHILEQLRNAGFSNQDVSVLFPEDRSVDDAEREPIRAASSKVGNAIDWLAGTGVMAIPGTGPFVVSGPIVAALSAATVGAALGGITRGLAGMGLPEMDARRYEGKVKTGNILISVCARGVEQLAAARKIFLALGALDISTVGEPVQVRERTSEFPASLILA